MPPSAPHRRVPSSAINAFIEPVRIDALLQAWVPDTEARAFVVRCLLDEGPAHHRGANYVLLLLLGELVKRRGAAAAPSGPAVPVPIRLPPHLAAADDNHHFPVELAVAALERLAPPGSPHIEAMIDCLVDGPPQHALANAVMVGLIESLLQRAEADGK